MKLKNSHTDLRADSSLPKAQVYDLMANLAFVK